jgi:alpha-1,6-mannosyltransferase
VEIVQLANFHAPSSGGLRVATDRLAAGYRQAGHRCTIVVPGPRDAITATHRTLRSPRLPGGSGYRVIIRRRAVLSALDELGPDRLEVHDKLLQPWVWTWALSHGVPVVLVSHERLGHTLPTLLPFAPARGVGAAAAAITRRAGRQCNAVVTCSAYSARDFSPWPVHVVPLGVDLAFFGPVPGRRPGPLRLVACSRVSAEKRIDIAIGAVELLVRRGHDVTLRVLGSGPLLARLRRQSSGLPIEFSGFEPDRRRVASALADADIALAPGPAETFGLAALEALAAGTPLVAVAGCATAELIQGDGRAGRAAPPTATGFADAVEALAMLPRQATRDAARRRAERYTWAAAVDRMLAIHTELSDVDQTTSS